VPKPNFGEHLFLPMLEEKTRKDHFYDRTEMCQKLGERDIEVPASYQSATLVPLVMVATLKAALCIYRTIDKNHVKNDMKMVADLAIECSCCFTR